MDLTSIGAGKRQKAFHEAREPVRFLQHVSDDAPILLPAPIFLQADFTDAPHRGQRSSQFVGGIGSEPSNLLK
jgi:hypothetical protein